MGSFFSNPLTPYKKAAKRSSEAYSKCDETTPSDERVQLLETVIVHHRDLLRERLKKYKKDHPKSLANKFTLAGYLLKKYKEDHPKSLANKFTLAGYLLEAGELGMERRHLEQAKDSYLELYDLWKSVNPKPPAYAELLYNIGKVHYELFEREVNKQEHGVGILDDAITFYERSLSSYKSQPLIQSEIRRMYGICITRKCELVGNGIRLTEAIESLSTVFATPIQPSYFEDLNHWHTEGLSSIVAELAAAIPHKPPTSRNRDLALLHLCRGFLHRYRCKTHGNRLDLIRAQAVAKAAKPRVSPHIQSELDLLLESIQKCQPKQGAPTPRNAQAGPSTSASATTSTADKTNNSSTQNTSPPSSYMRPPRPTNASTTSLTRPKQRADAPNDVAPKAERTNSIHSHQNTSPPPQPPPKMTLSMSISRIEPENKISRTASNLPIGNTVIPTNTNTNTNTQGKAKATEMPVNANPSQPLNLPVSDPSHTASRSSVKKSATSQTFH